MYVDERGAKAWSDDCDEHDAGMFQETAEDTGRGEPSFETYKPADLTLHYSS